MAKNPGRIAAALSAAFIMVFFVASSVPAEEYKGMEGVNNVNVIWDMRIGNPQSAVVHIKLIHETYKQLTAMKKNPAFVVVFIGPSVKLISSNQSDFSDEDNRYLKEISATITQMSKDGIDFEVCLAAVHLLGVDPATIQSEVAQVPNGWVSEIGYQARGYSLVPVYQVLRRTYVREYARYVGKAFERGNPCLLSSFVDYAERRLF